MTIKETRTAMRNGRRVVGCATKSTGGPDFPPGLKAQDVFDVAVDRRPVREVTSDL